MLQALMPLEDLDGVVAARELAARHPARSKARLTK
jgi:hypothetical protein